MNSIRKYLEADAESLQVILRVAQILVEGMAKSVVEHDPETYDRYLSHMLDISARFTERTYGSDCLVNAGAAVRSIEEYNDQTRLFLRKSREEYEGVVASLVHAVANLAPPASEGTKKLQLMHAQLSEAKSITDMKVARARIDDSLALVKEDAKRRAAELATVNKQDSRPAGAPGVAAGRDPLTGLPSPDDGQKMLAQLCAVEKGFLAVLTLDRLQLYNARYGRSIGDQVLRFFGQKFKEHASSDLHVFRWSGPTFIALSNRVVPIEDARSDIKRICEKLPSCEVELETRSASLAVTSRWAVFPISGSMPALLRKIEVFSAVQGARATADSDTGELP